MVNNTVIDVDLGFKELEKELGKSGYVETGYFHGKRTHKDGEIDMATLAIQNEFGTTITGKSGGGVAYGFKTKKDLAANKIRFFKNDTSKGYKNAMQLGFTKASGPYKIVIPERPFMRSAVDENKRLILDIMSREEGKVLDGTQTIPKMLNKIGLLVKSLIQKKIATASSWATKNAPSTVKAKGGRQTPLLDTGFLLRSIDFKKKVIFKGGKK